MLDRLFPIDLTLIFEYVSLILFSLIYFKYLLFVKVIKICVLNVFTPPYFKVRQFFITLDLLDWLDWVITILHFKFLIVCFRLTFIQSHLHFRCLISFLPIITFVTDFLTLFLMVIVIVILFIYLIL